MSANEFMNRLKSKKIKNGTKFKVYLGKDNLVCRIGVIGERVVIFGFDNIPKDLYTNEKYFFEKV
jgi:hypothetical protein